MRQVGLVAICFVAGLMGAMIGNDLSVPQNSEPIGVRNAVNLSSGSVRLVDSQATSQASVSALTRANPVIDAVKKVGPAVVNIDTLVMQRQSVFGFADPFSDLFGSDPFTRLVPSKGQGSGFIIDGDNGYVLTNDHVVHDAIEKKGQIKVSLSDKRTFEAKVIGADPQYDIAVLKIDGKNLPSVKLSDSDDLTIGEWAIAIGNPFGFKNTVTMGVVSALDRTLETDNNARLKGLIQTDAAINPGNSGGPLCDISGNIIGINTAIITGAEGLGFAIGASSVKPVVSELIKFGHIKHGWSGMKFWDISKSLADKMGLDSTDGALVVSVYNNGPADRSGIKPGDVVLQANGNKITSVSDIDDILMNAREGDELSLRLSRKGKTFNVKISLAEIPSQLE